MSIYLANAVRNKIVHGFFWSKEVSIFFKEEDGTIDFHNILGATLMALCKFLGFCCVIMTFNYAL
jgi:hypothetical protein